MSNQNQLQLSAQVEVAFAEGQPSKFSIVAYTGGVMVHHAVGPVILDLSNMQLKASIPILADHKNSVGAVVGQGKPRIESNQVLVAGDFADTDAGQTVLKLAKSGFAWEASVGIDMDKREFLKAGQSAVVNGSKVTADGRGLLIVRKSRLKETSIVPMGTDENTSLSIAASRETKMSDDLKALRAEFARIDNVCRGQKFRAPELKDRLDALRQSAIDGDLSYEGLLEGINKLHNDDLELADVRGERPIGPRTRSHNDPLGGQKVLECAFSRTLGQKDREKFFDEKTLEAADAPRYRGMGLRGLFLQAARANGCQADELNASTLEEVLYFAFPPRREQLNAAPTTISLPTILSGAANREILAGWQSVDDGAWRLMTQIKSVTTFHRRTQVRMLDNWIFEPVGPDGQIAHARPLGEESATYGAKDNALMASLTRVDIINDDLGALSGLQTRLGAAGARAFLEFKSDKGTRGWWHIFMEALTTIFPSNGSKNNYIGNYPLGTDGASLEAALLKFYKMKTSTADGSKTIGGTPSILVCTPENSFTADKLYTSGNLITGTGDTQTQSNIHAGRYRPVVCPRLSDAAYTNNRTTHWMLLRPASTAALMTTSFLNGNETPTIETAQADFNTLGVQMRGVFDFGHDVNIDASLAGVYSKGAA